ncbi:endolytic transglycosylase MltG, partial [Actinomyces oris]
MSHDDFFAELGIQRDEDAGDAKDKPKSRRQRRMEKVERRQRKRRRHWLTSLVIVITLVAVGVLGYKAIGIMRDASAQATHAEDYKGEGEGEVTVTIPEGASGADIGDILQSKGVVASGKAFTNAAKNNPKGNTIQPGTYKLKKKMSANSALQALLDPESKGDHTLTIPAGVSKQIVKDRLKKVGSFTDEQIEAAYADSAAIGLPAEAGGNVEGWLAPGTYDVTENATPKDLVKKMVSQTVTQLKELQVPKEDYQKVLTKASIVEREVNSERYYGQAARVIENRLSQTDGETHGLLQMDSTVQYGLGRYGGIPT